MLTKVFLIVAIFVLSSTADDLETCMQNKLKLTTPISVRDIQTGDFQKIPYATRSALQICHPTFDIVAGQIFRRLRPQSPLSETEIKCYESYLLKKNAGGLLTATFDKNLINANLDCDEIIGNFINTQVKQKMPNGTPGELQCLNNNIDKYMSGRFKAMILSSGSYEIEIFNDEKDRFVRELREVSENLIECLVALN